MEIREVKEVRIGKQSKDFEKWPEDAKRIENLRCFVIYYGSEFRLKTLSISGKYDIQNIIVKCWLFLRQTTIYYLYLCQLLVRKNVNYGSKDCVTWYKTL